jgi:hypothetical protein
MTRTVGLFLFASALAAGSGCSSVSWWQAKPSPAEVPFPSQQTIAVEFHPTGAKPEVEEIPFTPGMVVSDAITQTNAHKRFKRIWVDVKRNSPAGPHKMAIEWDRAHKRVSYASDYALHPNDRVIITQDSSNMLDDFMSTMLKTSPKRK